MRLAFVLTLGIVGGILASVAVVDTRVLLPLGFIVAGACLAILGDDCGERRYHDVPVTFNRRK